MAQEVGTGYVKIKAEMDDGSVAEVEKKGKTAGSGFGGAFQVAAGNLISSAITTIASNAAEVFSNAFNNYADYEQLIGGVETLFKESADAVAQNAANAYRTAGMSANEYMENVTAFSASLLQGLGGDTVKAAEIADMAMQDMSDNANKMGSDMATITTAYQGFAKQNYTMLDNLKLGYGGTKTEMERLLKDASEIAGVEFNIDNYSDVIEAIHVMQVEMGIAGTTSKEAASTISGSIAMLQASWQNFLTGVFDENADMGALGEQLFDSIGTVLINVVPRIAVLVSRAVSEVPTALVRSFQSIPALVGPTIMKVFGDEMGHKVSSVVFDAFTGIGKTVESAMGFITDLMEQAWPLIQDIVETAMTGIDVFMAEVWPQISQLIENAVSTIKHVIEVAWPIILSVIRGVMTTIESVMEAVWPTISGIVETAIGAIDSAVMSLGNLADFVYGVFESVKDAIENPLEAAKNAVAGIVEAIKGFFSFQVSLPHIPLPHFTVSPPGWGISSLLQGIIPSLGIDWYAKGGIVDGATLIGAGEAGPEAILPLQGPFMQPFAKALAAEMGGGGTYITVNLDYSAGEDAITLARDLARELENALSMEG